MFAATSLLMSSLDANGTFPSAEEGVCPNMKNKSVSMFPFTVSSSGDPEFIDGDVLISKMYGRIAESNMMSTPYSSQQFDGNRSVVLSSRVKVSSAEMNALISTSWILRITTPSSAPNWLRRNSRISTSRHFSECSSSNSACSFSFAFRFARFSAFRRARSASFCCFRSAAVSFRFFG